MVSVEEVWRWALPQGTAVLAGRPALAAQVTWVRLVWVRPAPLGALEAGELLLLSLERGQAVVDEHALETLVQDLAAARGSGLACVGRVPERVIAAAEAQRLPLLQLPPGSDLIAVERRVAALIVDRDAGLRRRVEEIHDELLAAVANDAGERTLLRILADATGKVIVTLDEYLQEGASVG